MDSRPGPSTNDRCILGYDNFGPAIGGLTPQCSPEDALPYNEPPDWDYPVRQSLGDVLLEAGRPREAEVVYWEDLRRRPENGWSLFGLAQSLRAQGRAETAAQMEPFPEDVGYSRCPVAGVTMLARRPRFASEPRRPYLEGTLRGPIRSDSLGSSLHLCHP